MAGYIGTLLHDHSGPGRGGAVPQSSVTGLTSALGGKVATAAIGAASGVCGLDSGSKVPAANLPNSVMDYRGGWDATTNTPTLADTTGGAGDVYLCTAAGTRNLGSGNITVRIGDYLIHSGAVWQLGGNISPVVSVNGETGAVTLALDDLSNVIITNGFFGTPDDNSLLAYDVGSGWRNQSPNEAGLSIVGHGHTPSSIGAQPALGAGTPGDVVTADAQGVAGWAAPGAGGAMQRIAVQSGAAASYSFTSIPQTYRSLMLVWSARGDTAATNASLYITCNADGAGNYDYQRIIYNGAITSYSGATVNAAYFDAGAMAAASTDAGRSGSGQVTIQGYASALYKGMTAEAGSRMGNAEGDQWQFRCVGEWRNVAAITRLDITPSAGGFAAGSAMTLYGLT